MRQLCSNVIDMRRCIKTIMAAAKGKTVHNNSNDKTMKKKKKSAQQQLISG